MMEMNREEFEDLSLNDTGNGPAAGGSNAGIGRGRKYKMSRESFHKQFAEIARRQLAEKPLPSLHDPKEVEYDMRLQREQAVEALKYYKAIKSVDFELSEIVSASRAIFRRSHGFHLNFEAVPKDGVDRSPKYFFAELFWFFEGPKAKSYKVTLCMIIDPSGSDVNKGCADCTDRVLHPKRVYFFCCPPEPPLQDTSEQSRVAGGVCKTCHRPYDGDLLAWI